MCKCGDDSKFFCCFLEHWINSIFGRNFKCFIFFPLQAVEELFALLRLFAGVTCDPSREKTKEEEAFEAAFRKDTIALYQSVLDPGASWTTLIRYKYTILYISTLLRFSQLSRNEHLPKMDH